LNLRAARGGPTLTLDARAREGSDNQMMKAKKGIPAAIAIAAALAASVFVTSVLCRIIPRYESTAHRSSVRLASELLAKGDTNRVLEAMTAYNDIANSGSTYQAALEMWTVLNHGPQTNENETKPQHASAP
jgi:hypothetical protein